MKMSATFLWVWLGRTVVKGYVSYKIPAYIVIVKCFSIITKKEIKGKIIFNS